MRQNCQPNSRSVGGFFWRPVLCVLGVLFVAPACQSEYRSATPTPPEPAAESGDHQPLPSKDNDSGLDRPESGAEKTNASDGASKPSAAQKDPVPPTTLPPERSSPSKGEAEQEKTERERRLESLSKTVEKEERPDKPSFSGSTRGSKNGAITFDDLAFEMEKGTAFKRSLLTNSINDLVGQHLKIKGFIRPSIRQKDLTKFIFVRDDKECCFGPGAAIYDCILVTLAAGKKSDYTVRPITVEGDFTLKEFTGPDGKVWAVYRMNNCSIK